MLGMSNVLYSFLSLVILITVSISSMFPKFGIQSFFALEVDINKYWLCKVGRRSMKFDHWIDVLK
jgi:hypothetical protein